MYSKLEWSLNQILSLFFFENMENLDPLRLCFCTGRKEEEKGGIIKVIKETRRAVELEQDIEFEY